MSIEDCNTTQVCKGKYVKILNHGLHEKNEQDLRLLAKGKCERFINEKYGKKDYIIKKSIHEVRIQYISRFGLLTFAGNYQHDKRLAKSNWLCRCNQAQENESHLRSGNCKVFGDIVERFSDLSHFAAVLGRRDQLDEFLQTTDGGDTTIFGANCVLSEDTIRQSEDCII